MFGNAFHITKVAGIPLKVHWTFGLFFIWIAYVGSKAGLETMGIFRLCLFALVLFVCVVLHELGHALTARRYGITTKDIIISPIGGIARLQRIPENPKQELLVAIAGPAVNLAIAIVLGTVLTLFTSQGVMPVGDPEKIFNISSNFLPALFLLNCVLIVFNLIPAFPMDGGRILRSFLSMKWGRQKATKWAASIGQVIAVAFAIFGIYHGDYILVFIGLFVFFSAASEYRMIKAELLLQSGSVIDVLRPNFTAVHLFDTMQHVIDLRKRGDEHDFIVVDHWGNIQGVLHEEFILDAQKEGKLDSPVSHYISPRYESISQNLQLKDVLNLFQQNGYSIIPVYHMEKMVGVVDRHALNQYIRSNTNIWQNWTSN